MKLNIEKVENGFVMHIQTAEVGKTLYTNTTEVYESPHGLLIRLHELLNPQQKEVETTLDDEIPF